MCVGPVEYTIEKESTGHSVRDTVEFYFGILAGLGFVAWLFWFAGKS